MSSASDGGRLSVLGGDRPVPPMKLKSTEFYELVRAIGTRSSSSSSSSLSSSSFPLFLFWKSQSF
jgi:hypothetical protein